MPTDPSTGSEDFGDFSPAGAEVRLCMFHLGCTAPERLARVEAGEEHLGLLHTPRFAPDAEPALRAAMKTLAAAALGLLGRGILFRRLTDSMQADVRRNGSYWIAGAITE